MLYLQYEQLHRLHPNWPLSDLTGMTARQRKHWIDMGKQRVSQYRRQRE